MSGTPAHISLVARIGLAVVAAAVPARGAESAGGSAAGPLRVHPSNPRYFTDGTKGPDGRPKAVYLTGSHTWGNLCDATDRKWPDFDYARYLQFLRLHNHNFFRLWAGDTATSRPSPYVRAAAGAAADGAPPLDLTRPNPEYFERLRARVVAARDQGIYVAVMLFQPDHAKKQDWPEHLFNPSNNVQRINGDTNGDGLGAEAYDLSVPAITKLQEAFARKVVDTVNDLDNVLYEIGNEGDVSGVEWQYHFIRLIKEYEAGKPKRHPVGMTAVFDIVGGGWGPRNEALLRSPADWISPAAVGAEYAAEPVASDGSKVVIADVDHIWPTAPQSAWVWKCFVRGLHPIHMDSYTYGKPPHDITDAEQKAIRRAMGQTRHFAERLNLAAMKPANDLASTSYCLADPGREYLVYLPSGGSVRVDLSAAKDDAAVEWFDPAKDKSVNGGRVSAGARELKSPFDGPAVLHLSVRSE